MNRIATILFLLAAPGLTLFGQTNSPAPASNAPPAVVINPKLPAPVKPPVAAVKANPATAQTNRPGVSVSAGGLAPARPQTAGALTSTLDSSELDAREIGLFKRIEREGLLKPGPSSSDARYFQRSLGDQSLGDRMRSMFRGESDHACESSVGPAFDTIFPSGD